ncbi:hypothetical protein IPH92_02305 [Candidatus Kaiserbacteria bacterium]|nr:MAG: hypothetical protein IPH92_02305 [Candidatus Kaiserbacteria bacterium]
MTEARKGEIALLVLKMQMRRDGFRIGKHIQRDIGNEAKAIGIPVEEAQEFIEGVVRELVEETFPKK